MRPVACRRLAQTVHQHHGILDPDRLRRHRKLAAEESRNSASLAERLARDKAFGKMTKGIMRDKRRRQDL
jgi:ribosome biogenesis GTPase